MGRLQGQVFHLAGSFSKLSVASPTSQLIPILKAFRHFTYVTAHSPLPSLYLRHNSFSNPSVASPTSQFILQPFFRPSYVTGYSLTSPGEPPMMWRDIDILRNYYVQNVSICHHHSGTAVKRRFCWRGNFNVMHSAVNVQFRLRRILSKSAPTQMLST